MALPPRISKRVAQRVFAPDRGQLAVVGPFRSEERLRVIGGVDSKLWELGRPPRFPGLRLLELLTPRTKVRSAHAHHDLFDGSSATRARQALAAIRVEVILEFPDLA